MSTFPFVLVFQSSTNRFAGTTKILKLPRLLKTLRALRLGKMLRVYQLDDCLGVMQYNLKIPPSHVQLVGLLGTSLIVNHYYACIWYMLGDASYNQECVDFAHRQCTWMEVRGSWYLFVTHSWL